MNEHINNIPDEVFDWLTDLDFGILKQSQKDIILCHFSEEEYQSLHVTIASIRNVNKPDNADKRKKDLLDQFNKKHPANRPMVNAEVFWRAAAIILFLTTAGLSMHFFPGEKHTITKATIHKDTVFIAKHEPPAPAIVHDTVFVKTVHAVKQPKLPAVEINASKPSKNIDQLSDDLNIVTMEDYGNKLNSNKSNSIKDDHLVQQYSFVSL